MLFRAKRPPIVCAFRAFSDLSDLSRLVMFMTGKTLSLFTARSLRLTSDLGYSKGGSRNNKTHWLRVATHPINSIKR